MCIFIGSNRLIYLTSDLLILLNLFLVETAYILKLCYVSSYAFSCRGNVGFFLRYSPFSGIYSSIFSSNSNLKTPRISFTVCYISNWRSR